MRRSNAREDAAQLLGGRPGLFNRATRSEESVGRPQRNFPSEKFR
jgi:hypothetical protein